MHIDSVQLFRLPLIAADAAGQGSAIESVLVGMASGGQIGWGEVSLPAAPCDSPEWSGGVFACLRDWLAPAIAGRTIATGEKLHEAMSPFQGNARAKAALDMAWHALSAARQGKPLYQLLGGQHRAVPLGATLGPTDSIESLLSAIGECFAAGYELVTLKFRPGWEIEMLRAVRQTFAVEPIAIDCDGLCSLGQQETFFRVEDFHLEHIEQPLAADDLVGHAMLQESLRTPICLHQSVTSPQRMEQILDLGCCRRVKIDVSVVGGFVPARAIHDACQAGNMLCALGGGPQGPLAGLAATALGTLPGFSPPGFSLSADCFAFAPPVWISVGDDVDAHGAESFDKLLQRNAEGKLERMPSDMPGAGTTVDVAALGQAAIEQATIA